MGRFRTVAEIKKMRAAGELAALTLQRAQSHLQVGVSTESLNQVAHDFIVSNGAYPAPLNYRGYPKSICTSINDVICHGIPSAEAILQDGDIINIDITVVLDGYFGDCSATFMIGKSVHPDRHLVMSVSAECLARSIAILKKGVCLGDIGETIQSYAESMECSVVREYVGHGIGKVFHEAPVVRHYGQKGCGPRLNSGTTFTIEPMINRGLYTNSLLADGWTVVTADGLPSAQFEHTLAVFEHGVEVYTALPNDPIVSRSKELGANILWPN